MDNDSPARTGEPLALQSNDLLGQLPTSADDEAVVLARLSKTPAEAYERGFMDGHANAAAEIERLRAVVAEWDKLRDPHVLHVNLLRGFPARLARPVLLHLAGDEEPKF